MKEYLNQFVFGFFCLYCRSWAKKIKLNITISYIISFQLKIRIIDVVGHKTQLVPFTW